MLKVEILARNGVRAPRKLTKDCLAKVEIALRSKSAKNKFTLSIAARGQLSSAEELSVVFVSAKEIRRLNREFRGKDKPTDVLSFESIEESSLGELVIAVDVIRAQAREHSLSLQDELGYMLLHGILHLLGYDHGRVMFGIQDQVFDRLRGAWQNKI